MNGCDVDSRPRPFHLNPDPRYFYCGPSRRRVLDGILGSMDDRCGPIVLIGQPGTGKTALVHQALLRFPPDTYTVFLRYTTLNASDLMCTLAGELGIASAASEDLLAMVRDALKQRARVGVIPVVIVDEAQNLCEVGLRRLCELSWGGLMRLVLVGQLGLHDRVAALQSKHRPESIAAVLTLDNLSASETSELVRHRLRAADEDPDAVFSPPAYAFIHEHSAGNPGRINLLCERALRFRSPDWTVKDSMAALRDAESSLEDAPHRTSIVDEGDAGGVDSGSETFLGTPADPVGAGRDREVGGSTGAGSGRSTMYTATTALVGMLALIVVTSLLVGAPFANQGTVPAESSDDLPSLRAQMASMSEAMAQTNAKQNALLNEVAALRRENQALRRELEHPSAGRTASGVWRAPVIEDFASLQTAIAFSEPSEAVEYWVRRGDTLFGVAHRHGLTLSQIARWNGLPTSAGLRVGERLVLSPREQLNYTVRWGDTLVAIKHRFDVTFSELRRWNDLPGDGRLFAGQRLRIYVSFPAGA